MPFPSRVKKQKRDDKDEWLLSNFKQIHINMPFLEAMNHMPKGTKVLKDLLSHKEKLEKAASSVKLSEECSVIIQRSLPQKEGDPGRFTLPWISRLKTTRMSIQLVDQSIKYPIGVCENLLVKVRKVESESSETVTFNVRKSMKPKHSRDNYLYCANYTAKLVKEQWVDTVDHDGKWAEVEEKEDSNKVQAVSFYPGQSQSSHSSGRPQRID
ncbi:hypothetical protein Tco_0957297 [Tanacetum coccineum]